MDQLENSTNVILASQLQWDLVQHLQLLQSPVINHWGICILRKVFLEPTKLFG